MDKVYFLIYGLLICKIPILADAESEASLNAATKITYITLKIDDFPQGDSLVWSWFLDYTLHDGRSIGLAADIGIIGSAAQSSSIRDAIAEYIANPNYDVYFHGWYHTKFNGSWDFAASRSYPQINAEFVLFHTYMQQAFHYADVIAVGAPANDFARHDYTDDFYRAVAANGYKIVFAGETTGDTGDGAANMDQIYCATEDFSSGSPVPLSADTIISCINSYPTAQGIYLQLHPGYGGTDHIWNAKSFGTLMARIHVETGRIFITARDYYDTVFLPQHPNYFLLNAARFLDNVFPFASEIDNLSAVDIPAVNQGTSPPDLLSGTGTFFKRPNAIPGSILVIVIIATIVSTRSTRWGYDRHDLQSIRQIA